MEYLLQELFLTAKKSGACTDDAVEAASMLAGDGGTLDNSFSLPRSNGRNTIFMKSRYLILTS
jgi:hypothetical protein